jgi:hypothetical protein
LAILSIPTVDLGWTGFRGVMETQNRIMVGVGVAVKDVNWADILYLNCLKQFKVGILF